MKNTLRPQLRQGKRVLGTWCHIPSPEVVDVIAKAGLDFIIVDKEHGYTDDLTMLRMVTAAQANGTHALVRVGRNAPLEILRALDTGADGVIVPKVETPQECHEALNSMLYAPDGDRGFTPYVRSGGYAPHPQKNTQINKVLVTGIIVESLKGLANLEAICQDPRLDLVYLGTYDLSVALGTPGSTQNPELKKILASSSKIIRKYKKAVGCLVHDPAELSYFKKLGVQFLCYQVDARVLYQGFLAARHQVDQ